MALTASPTISLTKYRQAVLAFAASASPSFSLTQLRYALFALDNYHCHRHGVSVTGDSYRFTEAEGIVPEAFCEAIDSLVCAGDITVSEASVVEPSPSAALDSNVLTEEEQALLDFLIAHFHGMDENNLCGSVEAFSHCLATDHDGLIALNAPIDLEAPDKDPILGS